MRMLSFYAIPFPLQHFFTAFISIGRKMRKIYFYCCRERMQTLRLVWSLCVFPFNLLLLCSPILFAVNSKERLKSNHRSVSFYIYSHVQRSTNGCSTMVNVRCVGACALLHSSERCYSECCVAKAVAKAFRLEIEYTEHQQQAKRNDILPTCRSMDRSTLLFAATELQTLELFFLYAFKYYL